MEGGEEREKEREEVFTVSLQIITSLHIHKVLTIAPLNPKINYLTACITRNNRKILKLMAR